MRLGLTQNLRAEQRMVQSPQMIQAMQILQCPMIELQGQIEQELQENVFLEVNEDTERRREEGATDTDGNRVELDDGRRDEDEKPTLEERLSSQFEHEIDQLEQRTQPLGTRTRGSEEESDRRLEMLYNTPDHGVTLSEHLLEQVREQDVATPLYTVAEHIVFSLDDNARLADNAEQIAMDLQAPLPLVEQAIDLIRSLDPPGVGAADLRDCLLMQLDRMSYVRPLTRQLVEHHLDDLALNKLPKIAKETGTSIDEIKDSWAFIRDVLNPHPGALFTQSRNSSVVPDVIVQEVDGQFEVRTERGSLPELVISASYRNLLREARSDPKVHEYLRKKIESAKWFIEAVHQRQNTIQRIASEIVRRQEQFLRHGVQHLVPMKMQEVADTVGVHISTVSRAINGKYVETPQGIFEIKRFFSGGHGDRLRKDAEPTSSQGSAQVHRRERRQANSLLRRSARRRALTARRTHRAAHRHQVPQGTRYREFDSSQGILTSRHPSATTSPNHRTDRMVRVTEAKSGQVIRYQNELFKIVKYSHIAPGNWRAIHHLLLRNLKTGKQKEVRMNTSDTIEVLFVETKNCLYSYKDANGFVFMDNESFEEFHLQEDQLGNDILYINEGDSVDVMFIENSPISLQLPASVVLEVVEAEEAARGDTVSQIQKTAKLNTGIEIKVPAHIKVGERVKVATETGEFQGRSSD